MGEPAGLEEESAASSDLKSPAIPFRLRHVRGQKDMCWLCICIFLVIVVCRYENALVETQAHKEPGVSSKDMT